MGRLDEGLDSVRASPLTNDACLNWRTRSVATRCQSQGRLLDLANASQRSRTPRFAHLSRLSSFAGWYVNGVVVSLSRIRLPPGSSPACAFLPALVRTRTDSFNASFRPVQRHICLFACAACEQRSADHYRWEAPYRP